MTELKVGDYVCCINSGGGVRAGKYYEVQELTRDFGGKFFTVKPVKGPNKEEAREGVYRTRFRMCTKAELSKLKKVKKAKTRLEDLIL